MNPDGTAELKRRQARRAPRSAPAHPARNAPASVLPQPPLDPRLIEGVGLYNHQQFFQCHEVVESLWLDTTGPPKNFYKGVIQAAVAFYHWSRGNLPGALTLARSSVNYLKVYRPVYCQIDVDRFVEEFSGLFQWLRRHRQRYDARLVPAIRWVRPPVAGSLG